MSGGSYDYAYRHPEEFAVELRSRLQYEKSPHQREMLARIADAADGFAEVMRAVEWRHSNDIDYEQMVSRSAAAFDPIRLMLEGLAEESMRLLRPPVRLAHPPDRPTEGSDRPTTSPRPESPSPPGPEPPEGA